MSATPQFTSSESAVTVGTTVAASQTIDARNARGMRIMIPSGSSITALDVFESYLDGEAPDDDSDWFEASDSAMATVVAGESIAFPDAGFPCGFIRLVGDVAGSVFVTRKG